MRTLGLLFISLGVAAAQSPVPRGPAPVVRGIVLERDAPASSGQFSVRAHDNQVYRYQFDGHTYVEREEQLIDVARLHPGEEVEVVSDVVTGSALRYARTIHVIENPPASLRPVMSRLRARGTADRGLVAGDSAGDLTYAGVVFRLSAERLVLHTRAGDQSVLLREETRYLENGEVVNSGDLKLNTRVCVRAGKDLYGEVEAYQVIWGGILDPR
jgi:hypothetical protein